jgi:hypothetical protein
MNYTPQTIWQPVEPYQQVVVNYTPLRFAQEFGPCSARHVAERIGMSVEYVTKTLRKAAKQGQLTKALRLSLVSNQQRRVAFYAEVK